MPPEASKPVVKRSGASQVRRVSNTREIPKSPVPTSLAAVMSTRQAVVEKAAPPPGSPSRLAPSRGGRRSLWWAASVLVNLLTVAAVVNWLNRPQVHSAARSGWSALDPQARCGRALSLVKYLNVWPLVCQWRTPGQALDGEAFPPPVGEPPWDHPRIVIYVAPGQSQAQVARVIAHEMGHMYLTRAATIGPAWIQARGLGPDAMPTKWVEDFAEVFAAVYGPDVGDWAGEGARPAPPQLAALAAQFFHQPADTPG